MSLTRFWLSALQRRLRTQRMARLVRRFHLTEDMLVLDVGGTADIWNLSPVQPRLIFLNQPRAGPEIGDLKSVVFGDGRKLPFADQAFDLVFSNSVIEHVGHRDDQAAFASEIVRVAKRYWVETPNRRFPIEQHLWTPVVHWLPSAWQRRVIANFSVWSWIQRPSSAEREFYLEHYLGCVRLLTAKELMELFPGGSLLRERFLGWTKALIACGGHDERT